MKKNSAVFFLTLFVLSVAISAESASFDTQGTGSAGCETIITVTSVKFVKVEGFAFRYEFTGFSEDRPKDNLAACPPGKFHLKGVGTWHYVSGFTTEEITGVGIHYSASCMIAKNPWTNPGQTCLTTPTGTIPPGTSFPASVQYLSPAQRQQLIAETPDAASLPKPAWPDPPPKIIAPVQNTKFTSHSLPPKEKITIQVEYNYSSGSMKYEFEKKVSLHNTNMFTYVKQNLPVVHETKSGKITTSQFILDGGEWRFRCIHSGSEAWSEWRNLSIEGALPKIQSTDPKKNLKLNPKLTIQPQSTLGEPPEQ